MEPLSAFSLACNILQIVEYGANVLSRAAQYRAASNGALNEHNTLYDVLQSLKGLNAELGLSLPPSGSVQKATVPELRLATANKECMRIADELIALLEHLKVKKSSTVEGIRMGIKSIWYEGKVKTLKHDLAEAKDNLSFALMLFMQHGDTSKQAELLRSHDESERRIIDAFKSTSDSLSSEIQALTAQLNSTSLLSADDALRDLQGSHQDVLAELSQKLDAILSHQETSDLLKRFSILSDSTEVAQQRINESLTFPQIDERRNKIQRAHRSTYQWVLDPAQSQRHFDDLLSWTRSQDGNRQLYWVYGKPGSGKSTLMRYLLEELDQDLHFHPWSENETVLKVDYFFWAPGTPLQKSFIGLLRSLLAQMFSHLPQIIAKFVPPVLWNKARVASTMDIHWTSSELIQTITAVVRSEMWYTFFLIDGLDEFEGTDQERDEFLDLIGSISSLSHVKLCVSSRPGNVFQDAFDRFPKIRLEDHTQEDIHCYIHQELSSQRRFEQLRQHNPSLAKTLIRTILEEAAGVFLWVRLVVYGLVKALRDGDNMHQLLRRVEAIPKDLDAYFTHLMGSIEPLYRREASIFLQLALYEEHEFTALHPLRLIDMVCIQDEVESVSEGQATSDELDFSNVQNMEFHLDSTLRRINSRCRGLLECRYLEGSTSWYHDIDFDGDETSVSQIFDWQMDFLHRSFWDFLSLPSSQSKLHEYSGRPFDARVLLCDSRMLQIEELNRSKACDYLIIGLASFVISTIAVANLRTTEYCKTVAGRLQLVLDRVVQTNIDESFYKGPWYLCQSLCVYHYHASSFLTIAIDFNLSAYVFANLTTEAIHAKRGRPILDYILRGAFFHADEPSIGNHLPDLALVQQALELGADPNEISDSGSIWVSFLVFLDNVSTTRDGIGSNLGPVKQEGLLRAVMVLLHGGACPVLPAAMLYRRGSIDWPKWQWEDYITTSRGDFEVMPHHLVSTADYLNLLRPQYSLAAKTLEDCIALASLKLAEKMAGSKAGHVMAAD
ncbi:hypothetical protein PFICI_03110 [Pestalotiopsis fici W106-1]|uniref:NACHT domain-containing protein n=1 Tax=Pestalotiopsis fici (strain W106-1 / CGMCC3.15140) TaxID=1229662 RepID=W3XGC4_PESFW|nr:uncharacterized protein PFICI_03110 [Pestalotiopsis fici W106-1]ETS85085.1 hypothetical protein PFICI_03110 [Pestalotiopsis fici W106-1]